MIILSLFGAIDKKDYFHLVSVNNFPFADSANID